jgi:hypothetical protein
MKDPIRNIEAIKVFANAVVIWLVVMGFWPLTDVQQGVTLTMVMTGINVIGGYVQNQQTTPLAEPVDEDNVPLVRATDGMPTEAQTRSMRKG